MSLLSSLFGRGRAPSKARVREAAPKLDPAAGRSSDPWFWSHYDEVPRTVLSRVPPEFRAKDRKIVDFGCGDGALTLGIASNVDAQVTGIDLTQAFLELPNFSERNLGTRSLPANLSFMQTQVDKPLPFADGSVDLIYSWSVFEHVADVKSVLTELSRIARPGGMLFIQIEPLFHGPYGSHLQRLVQEPWAHLLHSEEQFLAMAAAAADHVPKHEQDSLYRKNSFEDVKRYLPGEYKSLNRITAEELIDLVSASGFEMLSSTLIRSDEVPDPRLLEKYPLDLLLTNQIVLLAQRSKRWP